ncbi:MULTISPECIES: ATP-binding protein [Stenotrophomonas]|uniref:ATP-binding protein n=1 Tax=Stenotrophomonas TaxID=40323 RepID=UPI000B74B4CB|nr:MULTISPECIES: ATP-binding protein [Stenotrophomonas]SMR68871.1 extracellular solute-binding protein, family 3 [Stenotrophomonas sp. yr243]SNT59212.1 Signal transduction histidine kinase [Stenotrophomonas lactitubi]
MTALLKRARKSLLLALLTLLPCTSAGDIQHGEWAAGREVRVAAGPTLHPAPEDAADPEVLQTLAHGYASLVARHSGLAFVELAFPSTLAAMSAVCEGRADLVLVQGAGDGARLPCPSLTPSRSFHGGASVLAGRIGERLPRRVADVGTLRIAAVEGGPYPAWLAEHYPAVPVLPQPSMRAALAAVDAGIADAAIGLESTARPMTRRHFSHSLRLQVLDAGFPTQLHLLARREDQRLLERIEAALDDITVEEHARLLQRWAQQALPAAFGQTLRRQFGATTLWLLPALVVLLALPLLATRRLRLQQGLDQKQIQMAGMISHEVRNSAQAIMASIDLLGQAPLPAGQRELVAAAANAGHALRGLLNRTLDFSRLASGTFRPKLLPCDAHAVCTQALQAIAPEAQKKALCLQLSAPQAPFPLLATDPDCLRQLLDNLLGNAVKFTDVGGIELRLQLDTPAKPASLLIEVIDSGIGIAPAQMKGLFVPFQQADAGRQRGGSGLGLSICRTLAEAMGGTLDVHSVHGRGSRFILHLPVQPVQEDAQAASTAAALPRLDGMRILLVEDHALNRQVIAAQLRCWGATVQEAANADDALALQKEAPCPLVMLDIGLPGMDGYALARQLRLHEEEGAPRARLLALSAFTGGDHALRCQAAGIDAVLVKPLQIDALLRALDQPVTASTSEGIAHELVAAYEEDIDHELQCLHEAIARRDDAQLRHHAHRLQGALQMLGTDGMEALAGDLWELGDHTPPEWDDARQVLVEMQGWRGSRGAGTAPAA